MPVDTLKTIKQVEGKDGFKVLMAKMKVSSLFSLPRSLPPSPPFWSLVPVDTLKTIKQVKGKDGFKVLMAKMKARSLPSLPPSLPPFLLLSGLPPVLDYVQSFTLLCFYYTSFL